MGRAVGSGQVVTQNNGQVASGQIVAGSRVKLVHPSRGNKVAGLGTVLHERAQYGGRGEVLAAIHVDPTKSDGGSEDGVKIEDRLSRLLFWPIFA